MNMKLYKSCYDLAALSTCVQQNDKNGISHYMSNARIDFTDNFFAVARYKVVCSDYLSLTDYEMHEFEISFIRDEKLVETFHFKKTIDKKNLGSLANPDLDLESKLGAIKEYRPTLSDKLDVAFKKTKLASHEVDMIIEKNKKLFEEITQKQAKTPVKK